MITPHKIAVIGLGYVGLPLAIAFGRKYDTVGFDINSKRVTALNEGIDQTRQVPTHELQEILKKNGTNSGLTISDEPSSLNKCNVYIITVPTPINQFKSPNLAPLLMASEMIGKLLKVGDIVIYESTVYPGCTEEDCVPVLEKFSGLVYNQDFFCGYSPERINPGDQVNTLSKIRKVTSGSNPQIARVIDDLYKSIIIAGTYLAPSIKIAEASKAIENAQRDLNISFMNELALIFDRMGIDTNEVIEAASTKWNFLKFKPGLVGGHCIGVDPYYLVHKAESHGYFPQVILSGRRVNDQMGIFIANKVVKLLIRNGHMINGTRVLILGLAFKENCPDIRNTKVVDIYRELIQLGLSVEVYDPLVQSAESIEMYGLKLIAKPVGLYDAIILAVAHDEFLTIDYERLKKSQDSIIFDTKAVLDKKIVTARL